MKRLIMFTFYSQYHNIDHYVYIVSIVKRDLSIRLHWITVWRNWLLYITYMKRLITLFLSHHFILSVTKLITFFILYPQYEEIDSWVYVVSIILSSRYTALYPQRNWSLCLHCIYSVKRLRVLYQQCLAIDDNFFIVFTTFRDWSLCFIVFTIF